MDRREIEIMAPVGSYESLMAAVEAGADSVYFGVGNLNMRAHSSMNFTLDDLSRIVEVAHGHGLKTYLTVNTVIYDDEIAEMHAIVDRAREEGVDAVIASDMAVILYAYHTGVEVHISTQCNVSNTEAVKFFSQWADVVVLARELNLDQIARIHREIVEQDIRGPRGKLVRIEMFAHGALCMSISGKCYLSEHMTGHSANRGACRQICRRKYTIADRETGEALDVDGRYILSPKDLCTVDFLDKFIGAGVSVLKIEGRARGGEYVKRVVGCYDRALRAIGSGEYTPEGVCRQDNQLLQEDLCGGAYRRGLDALGGGRHSGHGPDHGRCRAARGRDIHRGCSGKGGTPGRRVLAQAGARGAPRRQALQGGGAVGANGLRFLQDM